MKKRFLATILCLCTVVTLLPITAIAVGEAETAIQLGAGGIAKGNTVYYGNYAQSDTTGVAKDPIKWRVLSTTPNGTKADGGAWSLGDGLLLLSDQNLDAQPYHVDFENVTWEKSTLRSWMNGYAASENIGDYSGKDYTSNNFINTAFSERERAKILQTKLENANNPIWNTAGGNATTDKVFALSTAEANTTDYFAENNSRVGTNTAYVASKGVERDVGEAYIWWLRSPGFFYDHADIVDDVGDVTGTGYNVNLTISAVRPAFNLDLNSALFASAAVGGKSSGTVGAAALNYVAGAAAVTEWKLTLKDYDDDASTTLGHDGFAASLNSASSATVAAGGSVSVDYYGAATGDNEYISAMLVDDSGTVLYYGNIVNNSASGTAQAITIPAGIAEGNYKLKIFNEQVNGDKKTDYASAFSDIEITVDNTAATLTAGVVSRTSDTAAAVKFTSDEAGEYYYAVVDSGAGAPMIDKAEQTITLGSLTTGAKDIYIVVRDAAGNVSANTFKINIPAYVPIDATPPTLTAGAVSRTGDSAATVKFTSDEAGKYYYEIVDSGADAPTIDTTGTGTTCDTAEQIIAATLTAGAKDIYIVVKDAEGNVSANTFKIAIPAYVPNSYAITAAPASLPFGSAYTSYAQPTAQTVTITNTGNQSITLTQPTATNYDVGTLSTTILAKNGDEATFTVTPKTGLSVGVHNKTITVSGSNGVSANVAVAFTVQQQGGGGYNPETVYPTTEGAGGTWAQGEINGYSFTFNAPLSRFRSVLMDGNTIASNNYDSREGSTIITLHEDYLATLSAGSHTLRAVFSDGYAQTTFSIVENEKTNTDTNSNESLITRLKDMDLVARSKQVTLKNGKKAIKIVWLEEKNGKLTAITDVDFDGIQIFRSNERYKGYGQKPLFSTAKNAYYNTAIQEGETYFYKLRGFKVVDGVRIYTNYSLKAMRKVK